MNLKPFLIKLNEDKVEKNKPNYDCIIAIDDIDGKITLLKFNNLPEDFAEDDIVNQNQNTPAGIYHATIVWKSNWNWEYSVDEGDFEIEIVETILLLEDIK